MPLQKQKSKRLEQVEMLFKKRKTMKPDLVTKRNSSEKDEVDSMLRK